MNSKMVPTRLASLVLCLLYLLHALRDSSAYTRQTSEMHGNGQILTGENVASFQKETVEDVRVATPRKVKLGERKMAAVSRREREKEGKTSVISGNHRNASKRVGRSQDQHNSPMLEPKTLKPVHFPSTNPHDHFQASKTVSTKATANNSSKSNTQVSQEPAQKDESQRLVDAEEEIANLMRKDYKEDGKPHHKPPINNHKPTD